MKLANVLDTLRPAVRAMTGYVPGEQPQAGKFIKLNTNENPYPPSERVAVAVQEATSNLQRYPDPIGSSFRVAAGEVLGVDPDTILCGNGSDDILTILTRAFVPEGGTLAYPSPSYVLYGTLAEIQGATAIEFSFRDDWSLPDVDELLASNPHLVFIPNPNSPSGTCIPRESLIAWAEQLTCPLVIDEAYVDFADSNCLDLVTRFPHVMVTRTLSKSYGLAGLRFGFLVAQPDIVSEMRKVKDSYNCDAIAIAAATAAITDRDWFEENRRKVLATRHRLASQLRMLGFEVLDSQANFVWCTHPQHDPQALYEQLKNERILVRYMNYPAWGKGLRISVGTDEQIDALLTLLAPMVRQTN